MDAKPKNKLVEIEEKILAFWNQEKIFEKTLAKEAPKGDFVFYDGPPFATGLPHFGHLLPTTIKDAVPRYKTMRGYRVRRRWGWDCHGLPVENLIEKELNLKSKKDIVDFGIGRFNEAARQSVLRYEKEWRHIIPRIGRWVDMDKDYKTMDSSYTESVWWAFKKLHDKGLVYEGYKSMQICPRCETTLSNFEVTQGYKDVTDISVYVKFELIDLPAQAGEHGTFFLAWTTTPWTLPGNVALAVGADIEYSKVFSENATYIVATDRVADTFAGKEFETTGRIFGRDLVGKEYEPVFPYYDNDSLKNRENGFKVYAADFVTTTDGTGIVHIAPAFGEDDMKLGVKEKLPFIQHVAMDGSIKKEAADFAGLQAKPKDDPQKTDVEIIKYLAGKNTLFAKKKIIHSYPHCWRCDTPLLNYATSSWFVKVTDFKDKLVAANRKISWVPEEIGQNRFGDWLANARDWAISRSRFWGAPIPVWRKGEELVVIGSVAELKKYSRAKNTYFVMRHGEADNNVKKVLNGADLSVSHLTARGREQSAAAASILKKAGIDLVYVSPFARTKETAAVVKDELGLKGSDVVVDDRLREVGFGEWEGKEGSAFGKKFPPEKRFESVPPDGEKYGAVKKRLGGFLYDIEKKNQGKKILIVTHGTPASMLFAAANGFDREQSIAFEKEKYMENAEVRPLDFAPLPHNDDFELDLHRPFIDDVALSTAEGEKLSRVPEVFDCWFESGAMPFAEAHYPFEKTDFNPRTFWKSVGFPADFIAEGLDQTRGWFYSMLVLSVALFGKSSYKNVIVNGLILAEDGTKMSKSKGNFPPLMPTVEKYGSDSLRLFLAGSPAVHAEDVRFSEKGVDEVSKKFIQKIDNVLVFYELYVDSKTLDRAVPNPQNTLDVWILSRLAETIGKTTAELEKYRLDAAIRPLFDFVDDLSNWYIRRSRDRFKSEDAADKAAALSVTRFVLREFAKIIAPFTPFYAEYLFGKVRDSHDSQSVHLEKWPEAGDFDAKLIADMKETRRLVTLGLEVRAKTGIKVRQPLSQAMLKTAETKLSQDFLGLIQDELNVKSVSYADIKNEIEIDTAITPELREEGIIREVVRAVQELRKAGGFSVDDKAILFVDSDEKGKELVAKAKRELGKTANVVSVAYEKQNTDALSIEDYSFKLKVAKK